MDDIITQTNTPAEAMQRRHKKNIIIGAIVIIVVLAAIIGGVFWYIKKHQGGAETSEQALQALDASSAPITATANDRATSLTTLHTNGYDATASNDDRLKMLNSLSNN